MKHSFLKLGSLIKQARIGRGINQLHLANMIGMAAPQLNRLENGQSRVSLEDAFRIENALGISDGPISGALIAEDYKRATGRAIPTSSLKTDLNTNPVAGVQINESLMKVVKVGGDWPKTIYLKLERE